jgi:tRNA pseudouridine38/39 synthase
MVSSSSSQLHPILKELLHTSPKNNSGGDDGCSPLPKVSAVEVLNHLLQQKILTENDIKKSIQSLKDEKTKLMEGGNTAAASEDSLSSKKTSTQQGQVDTDDDADNSRVRRRHIAIQFYYDGGDYSGLAQNVGQDSDNSVERVLFEALQRAKLIESRETSGYSRCGRTDRGVSSAGQVVALHLKSSFLPDTSWDEEGNRMVANDDLPKNEHDHLDVWTIPRQHQHGRIKKKGTKRDVTSNLKRQHKPNMKEYPYSRILNNLLPPSIRVLGWVPVSPDFSARFSATTRTYRYFFCKRRMDINTMRQGLKLLVGRHDFRNLCKMDVEHVSNFERVIHAADIVECTSQNDNGSGIDDDQQVCYFQILGQAFLWHQIRCIVEVMFYIGRGLEEPSVVSDLLDVQTNQRKPSYPLADECPLVLHHCGFANLSFGYSVSNLWTVSCQLERQWEDLTLAAARLRNCINSFREVSVRKDDLVSFCESKLVGKNKKIHRNRHLVGSTDVPDMEALLGGLPEGDIMGRTISWNDTLPLLRGINLVPDSLGLNTTIHIPLLQRSKGTTYEEKVQALHLNDKRRMRYEENVIQKRQPAEVDKEFYARKQQQGGQGL